MKYIISALFLLISSAALSYTIKIKNITNSDMIVSVKYGGPGVCSPDNWRLPANGEISHGVGGCCAKSGVIFSAKTGPYEGKEVSFDPPRTGFGLSCRSWNATAVPVSDTVFTVEQGLVDEAEKE